MQRVVGKDLWVKAQMGPVGPIIEPQARAVPVPHQSRAASQISKPLRTRNGRINRHQHFEGHRRHARQINAIRHLFAAIQMGRREKVITSVIQPRLTVQFVVAITAHQHIRARAADDLVVGLVAQHDVIAVARCGVLNHRPIRNRDVEVKAPHAGMHPVI